MLKASVLRAVIGAASLSLPLLVLGASGHLSVPVTIQEHSEWCWSAASDAVLTYRGISTSQCKIANWQSDINYACGQPDFYWNDGGAGNSPNYLSGTTGISGILWSLGRRDSSFYNQALSYSSLKSAIDRHNPIIILWQWSGGGGHFVVIDGYDDARSWIYFMNPWPGEGAEYGSYSWMRGGSSDMGYHTWAQSLITY